METGIVVDNFDPTFSGKCKIRIIGKHTEKVGGVYTILDDDLPWVLPASTPATGSGSTTTPKVGERVYVECIDGYTYRYHGQVKNKGLVKKLLQSNADVCDDVKVLLYTGEPDENGDGDYVKIYYTPTSGLLIEADGNKITFPNKGSFEITAKSGAGITIDSINNDITIHTDGNVNLDCQKVNLCEGASESVVLGSALERLFNNHTHLTTNGPTTPPQQKLLPNDFSKKVKII